MAQQPDDVERILRSHAQAPSTHERDLAFFDHWRLFLRNLYGPDSDRYIPESLHRKAETRVCEFVVWQFMIGVRGSSVMTNLAAINYFHRILGLGRPLDNMTRLHRLLRASRRLDGRAVTRCSPE